MSQVPMSKAEKIVEYLKRYGVHAKVITGRTTIPTVKYNKYFIDDEYQIFTQHVDDLRSDKIITTVVFRKDTKPFSVKFGSTMVAWDGFRISRSKV